MKFRVLALLTVALLAQSCSLFVPSMTALSITASDPRADIYVDGAQVGRGTASTRVKRNESHSIMAKVGDRVGVANVGTSVSATGILDIVGGVFFLIPFIGIAGPGFYSLDSNHITVVVPSGSGT